MSLQIGDWVRTETGLEGEIVLVSRLSAFIEVREEKGTRTVSYLLSSLKKIDPPGDENKPPSAN
jgi:hypothetical protein